MPIARNDTEAHFAAIPAEQRNAAARKLRTAIAQLEAVANALDGDVDDGTESPVGELAARVLKRFGIVEGTP